MNNDTRRLVDDTRRLIDIVNRLETMRLEITSLQSAVKRLLRTNSENFAGAKVRGWYRQTVRKEGEGGSTRSKTLGKTRVQAPPKR